MRDINRIKPFLEQFEKMWTQNPDYRFGQLVKAIFHNVSGDMFYAEDEYPLAEIVKLTKKDN